MVGVPGLDDAREARAHEHACAGERGALRDQGFHQGLRLGAGLAPQDAVAGTNYTSEIHHRTGL